jgi:hypothetical protein
MSIKPGIQYDHSLLACIIGRPTMCLSGDQDNSNDLATHALPVFLICCFNKAVNAFVLNALISYYVSRCHKTVEAYEFTGNNFLQTNFTIKALQFLKKCTEIGLTVKVFISEMGG